MLAIASSVLLTTWRHGEPDNWLDLKQLKWLSGLSPVVVLASVYGLYLVYSVLFKLVAGRTLGESLVQSSNKILTNSVKA